MDKKTECEIVQDLLFGYADEVLNTQSKKLVEKQEVFLSLLVQLRCWNLL